MVRVPVLPGASFTVGEPSVLFSLRGVTDWDVAPGGRGFIVIRAREGQQGRLVVVENFFKELRKKVTPSR